MRTTIDLDAVLLERAKRLALKDGRTLSAIVNGALASYLGGRKDAAKEPPFELVVCGTPGGHFPSSSELADAEDADELDALRITKAK